MKQFLKVASIICLFALTGCYSIARGTDKQSDSNKHNQRFADINVQLGVGYMQQGNMPLAKQKLLTALASAPDWTPALEAMAYYYQVTGEADKAQDYYLQALKTAPKKGSTLNNYGAFLCKQGRYRESLDYFQRAASDENYLKLAEVFENAGLCASKIPDYKLAEFYLNKAQQQDPSRILLLLDLADVTYQQKKYREALNYLNNYAVKAQLDSYHAKMRENLVRKLRG